VRPRSPIRAGLLRAFSWAIKLKLSITLTQPLFRWQNNLSHGQGPRSGLWTTQKNSARRVKQDQRLPSDVPSDQLQSWHISSPGQRPCCLSRQSLPDLKKRSILANADSLNSGVKGVSQPSLFGKLNILLFSSACFTNDL
jgi:hypothetical protein